MFVKSNVSGASVESVPEVDDATDSTSTRTSTADLVSPTNVQNRRSDILTFRRTPRPVRGYDGFFLRCVLASLYEGPSVRRSIGRSVTSFLSSVNLTRNHCVTHPKG